MFARLLRADLKRIRYRHLYLACVVFGLIVAAAYASSQGSSWVSAKTIGFIPGPVSDLDLSTSSYPLEAALACAAVANTLFFPILATVFIHQLYFEDIQDCTAHVSYARGISRCTFFCAKLAATTIALQGCYLLFCAVATGVLIGVYQPATPLQVIELVTGKVLLNCLINESFIVLCMAVFSWIRNGPTGAGVIVVATFMGLIACVSSADMELPLHMGYWGRVCGLADSTGMLWSVLLFSSVSFALFALLAYGGLTRLARR